MHSRRWGNSGYDELGGLWLSITKSLKAQACNRVMVSILCAITLTVSFNHWALNTLAPIFLSHTDSAALALFFLNGLSWGGV